MSPHLLFLIAAGAVSQAAAQADADTAPAPKTTLEAREIRGRSDIGVEAEGDAELHHGDIVIRADRLSYDQPSDRARAAGNVRVLRQGDRYTGTELELKLGQFEGYFLEPTYFFALTQAGGSAKRLDFLDKQRAIVIGATYSSCPADGSGDPAWLLSTSRIRIDFEKNEGIAEGAVLRFYGVPILAAPVLSFPLTGERKSGWLPPTVNLDNKGGLQVSVPYYWNVAPNRDTTLTPSIISKRGLGLDTEFRYLEPRYEGQFNLNVLPNDQLTGSTRGALDLLHQGLTVGDTRYSASVLRVSDDEYWKDFPRNITNLTPRLLPGDVRASRSFGDWTLYTRVQRWQVLQDPFNQIDDTPYNRSPQLGVRTRQPLGGGFELELEGEANRFTNPRGTLRPQRTTGARLHALGDLSRPWVTPGWSLVPKLSVNAAAYSLDQPLVGGAHAGQTRASRIIPTLSVDSAWVLERDTAWFGRPMRQTLEPRLFYVRTPYRNQDDLPKFDAAAKDFNFDSIYTGNVFSGVDRVSDADQVTAGVTTRVFDPSTGIEALRLGIAQRYLLRDQRITSDEQPIASRFSDVLLLGSTSLVPRWQFDASVRYDPETNRAVRSILSARYFPGPYRTVNATYRVKRGESEQFEIGWQWPVYGPTPGEQRKADGCNGTWYSVGRINYSTRDRRITDSAMGLEYDAGCWIGRLVAKRLSTSQQEATTQLGFELELVGLSRLGTNPLRVLKDNIPGYQPLRGDAPSAAPQAPPPP